MCLSRSLQPNAFYEFNFHINENNSSSLLVGIKALKIEKSWLGWESYRTIASWGINLKDGKRYEGINGTQFATKEAKKGDVVKMVIHKSQLSFFINSQPLGIAFDNIQLSNYSKVQPYVEMAFGDDITLQNGK